MTNTNAQPATLARIEELRLICWTDQRRDPFGHDPRSSYVEQFWLGILGPSTTWFLRICANHLDSAPEASINLTEVARTLGIGHRGGSRSAMVRTVARACRFGAARSVGNDTLAVRRRLPMLTHRQLQRLPLSRQRCHEEYVASDASNNCISELRLRARRLALGLVECGDSPDSAELQLAQWKFHPAVASDAVRWALRQHQARNDASNHRASDTRPGGQHIRLGGQHTPDTAIGRLQDHADNAHRTSHKPIRRPHL